MSYKMGSVVCELNGYAVKKIANRRFAIINPSREIHGVYSTTGSAKLAIRMMTTDGSMGAKKDQENDV